MNIRVRTQATEKKILSPLGLTSRRVHYAGGNLRNSVSLFNSPLHLVDI